MGASIVRFDSPGFNNRWGIQRGDEIAVLEHAYTSHRDVMNAYFNQARSFDLDSLERIATSAATLLSPVTRDIQIFCQGLNYASHREEGGVDPNKGENLIFSKPPSSICGPRDDVIRPEGCVLLDYEIEVALVLKKDLPAGTEITTENLLDFVGGFTLTNDVSARDFMFGAPMMQWFKGKGQRTFCPTGPILYLLDANEYSLIDDLRLTLKLNGDVRQDATSDQLIFSPSETLTELASFTDVRAGDMLLTGTPGGVILNATPKVGLAILLNFTNDAKRRAKLVKTQKAIRYMQPGDILELALTSRDGSLDFGRQVNSIVDAGRSV